jgi:KDO2-lipid IV(A) lauroyltransferase
MSARVPETSGGAGRSGGLRRTRLKNLRDRAEAFVVHRFEWLARRLPVERSVRLGELLGGLLGKVDRRRRRVAVANLELAFGDALDAAGRARIVDSVYRHLGRFLFEYIALLERRELRPLSRFIEIEGLEVARAALREHGAVIFVTLHLGHWELLGGAVAELVTPLHAVMKPLRNPYLNEQLVRLRSDFGMVSLAKKNVVPALFRCLREGKSIALFSDLDQKRAPLFADFFGVPAATVATPALLALRAGKPIVCGASWSTGEPLRYRGILLPPIVARRDADPKEETLRITAEINRHCEAFVREHPGQWNWIHPRWKTRPESVTSGADIARI